VTNDYLLLIVQFAGQYLGLRGTREQGNRENYIMRSLVICTPYPILCGW